MFPFFSLQVSFFGGCKPYFKIRQNSRGVGTIVVVYLTMNSSDFLIIYFSCGAPLSTFYFLQNRQKQNDFRLWLKTFFTFIFWLPFAVRLLANKARKKFAADRKGFFKTHQTETEIFLFQKQFEEVLQASKLQISIFEFREVIERYVGLTIAVTGENTKIIESEKEIFRIADDKNVDLGAVCLNRRNLKKFTIHQIQARQDFFQIIGQLAGFASDREKFLKFVSGFFRVLNDTEAQFTLEKTWCDNLRNERSFPANRSENFLWKTETRQLTPEKFATLHLHTLTTNSPAKD